MKSKGFTLIELLVVVAIIGILAAVGVVAYNGYTSSAKIKTTQYNHQQAVRYMKTLIFNCETQGYVTLKTSLDGQTSDFQCSSGTDVLRQQFTVHFYLSGFRNSWTSTKGVYVKGVNLEDYMIGFSCSNNGAMGFTLICNENNSRMWMETNLGPTKGCSGCSTTTERVYIDIPK